MTNRMICLIMNGAAGDVDKVAEGIKHGGGDGGLVPEAGSRENANLDFCWYS